MILPNNGKVVIIDDNHDEVKHLMHALTRERMPFLFFKDQGGDDLPPTNNPIENIRLVFLDLDLGIGGLGDIEMIRVVQGRLIRILKPKTPYVLVIWSNHEDRLSQTLYAEFNGPFSDYKPIASCSLDKSVIRKPVNNVVEVIRENLKKCLQPLEAFNAFLLWESIVNKSSGEIVNGFTSIFDFDNKWNDNLKAFFYRLGKANVGELKIGQISNEMRLQLALETITSALIDSIEKNIRIESKSLQLEIVEQNSNITPTNLIEINTKLHLLSSDQLEHFQPGNIYISPIIDETMVSEVVKNTFQPKFVDDILNTNPKTIKVDLTPICDYSQDKGYTRLLSGILVPGKYKAKEIKKNTTPIFIYDLCPVLEIESDYYYIVFDFRYFKALKQEYIKEHFQKPNYKIRSQLLNDLQAGLSNHINRPGIVSVL